MTNHLLTAAILDGMNAHNRTVTESTKAGEITLIDYDGNRYTLHIWVKADLSTHYLLECNRIPNALGNIFRADLPDSAEAFDDNDDLLEGIAATRNVAKTVTITARS